VGETVKSQPLTRPLGGPLTRRLGGLLLPRIKRGSSLIALLAILAAGNTALGDSVLLGPTPRPLLVRGEIDPSLPTGAERWSQLDLGKIGRLRCSPQLPLCVGSPSGTDGESTRALAALEAAWKHLVIALGLSEPLSSDAGEPLTWILEPTDRSMMSVALHPRLGRPFDSASVVCRSGAKNPRLDLERDAHLCVGEGIAARLDAGETPRNRRAYALSLWWSLGSPRDLDVQDIADSAHRDWQSALGRDDLENAPLTALVFEYFDRVRGTAAIDATQTGVFALSAQHSDPSAPRYQNHPDVFDVLRRSLDDDHAKLAQMWRSWAVARVLLAGDTGALARLGWVGDLGRLEPAWTLPVSSLPRRVAPAYPLAPLGMTAVRVLVDQPLDHQTLGLRVTWEPPSSFVWTVLKLGPDDREIGRVDLAYQQRATLAEQRLVLDPKVRSLLVLGINLGGVDLAHPSDPDHAPFEPHGCTVYLARL